jgi:tetratricopeptide (TPR) repeat protein
LYLCAAAVAFAQVAPDPDALYADRTNLASARQASELWKTALASNPRNFDAAWKLARADFWMGGHVPEAERRGWYEQGIDAARKAIALEANRPEGHFWLGANMGVMAESFGIRAGLKYRGPIKDALETVLRIDPKFQQGSADRALGRWYAKVPGLFGGSNKKAEEHYRAALKENPISTATHFYYAELLEDMGRKQEARAEAQAVLDAPLDPFWGPEDRDFKEKAKALLNKLK